MGRNEGTLGVGATSENRQSVLGPRRRGRLPVALPPRLESVHAIYRAELTRAPLSAETRRTYASKVRQYLAWLDAVDGDGAPLTDPGARDRAVREWRTHLLTVAGQAATTVNNALAAVDDFYRHRGLGRAVAERMDVPAAEPRALDEHARLQWLRAVEAHPSPRDRALASIPFYAGARIAETVRLDTRDVRISGRTRVLSIHGKGDRIREVPIHPKLRGHLRLWLEERPDWAGADTNPALFLNRRGGRLSVRGAHDVIVRIAEAAGLSDETTAHVLRHTFATALVRGGTDLVIVAELLGHARLDTTRGYTKTNAEDRIKAVDLLPADR
jgi:site-specific recombinase XerD